MGVSWCKVASNLDSHPKIRKAGRLGREVFLFALRRNAEPHNDEPGCISADELGSEYLADMLQMSVTEAVTGVTAAVTAGLIAPDGDKFLIVGWREGWGKDNGTGAVRTARYRENKRLRAALTHVTSHDVTDVTRDACDTEEKRLEEKRREEREDSDTPAAVGDLDLFKDKVDKTSRGKKPKPNDPTPAERSSAERVLAKLSDRNGVRYTGSPEHIRIIVAQLRAGATETDLRKVIGYCAIELEWAEKPEMATYLRPETLFGPKTINRYLDPARTWFEKQGLVMDDQAEGAA